MAGRFGWAELTGVSRIRRGNINDSFHVTTRSGDYVLQRLNPAVFSDVEGLTANLLLLCRTAGRDLVPEPVAGPDGRWIVETDGAPWRAWRRVVGDPVSVPLETTLARSAGGLLGRFHGAISGLEPARLVLTLPGFHDLRRRRAALEAIVAADPLGRAAGVHSELDRIRAFDWLVELTEDLEARVPVRVAHFDTKLDNLLFRDGRAVCLVDLDTVMPGAWFWDLGDLLRTATVSVSEEGEDTHQATVDASLYEEVVTGYLEAIPSGLLTSEEVTATSAAGAIAAFEQATRFLVDWLEGDVYFRTARPVQNLDRARTQLDLLASMPTGGTLR